MRDHFWGGLTGDERLGQICATSHLGRGTYILVLRLTKEEKIAVGRLGSFLFPAGFYLYAGSALGPGGLAARLARHRRLDKRKCWHIDYLRACADWVGAYYSVGQERRECSWARALGSLPGASLPAPRFGASDCRCPAHLVHLAYLPDAPLPGAKWLALGEG
jgi:Uri superfamily endonuclease